jgi:glycosyltransferase involved in cell wall biosynthesis
LTEADNAKSAALTRRVPTVAVIGPLPPPIHGHMIFTERLLRSKLLAERFRIVHVDISDHRDMGQVGRIDPLNVVLAVRDLGRLIRTMMRERPDLVHAPLAQNLLGLSRDLCFVAIALIGRAKVVIQLHGGAVESSVATAPRWFSALARTLLHRCTAFIAMNGWQVERLGPTVPPERTVVIPHATDDDHTPPSPRRQDRFRALYVSSSLQESKGLTTVLEAATCAQRNGVTTEWEIIGPWLDAATENASMKLAGETGGIRFPGAVDRAELRDAYARADVFVFPTGPTEAFALVRIEAMSAGLPVITTEAGGGNEMVREGVEGFIVDYDEPDQIVARLRQLRDDPELHAEMGRNAQARQRTVYGAEAFERSIAELWERVAA